MKYIDIHCHLDFKDYELDKGEVLARMVEQEVGAITIGTDLESSKKALEIANQNENIWACIGVHPVEETSNDARGMNFEEKEFEELVKNPKVVAIGECGLDWFRLDPANIENEKKRQTELFEKQIEFALTHNKPLMLHCRDSYDDVLNILEEYKKEMGEKLRGNSHFFAGNIEQAKRFLNIGFTLSFTGVITFAHNYDEVIKFAPLDSIMSETDAPFVAPVPYRGKRNEPSFVSGVVKKMAEIKEVSEDIMGKAIINNASRIFKII